jgi:hypothetical protein
MTDEPYSADDEKQVRKRQSKAKEATERQQEDWRWLLADKRGRRIAWALLEEAGVFRSSFNPDRPHATAFNEGIRNTGLRVLASVMQADPEAFTLMSKEARE